LEKEEHIDYIIAKASSAHFGMGIVTVLIKTESSKLVYFPYVQSIRSYRIIFRGNSTEKNRILH
jgi:hypothetical protein